MSRYRADRHWDAQSSVASTKLNRSVVAVLLLFEAAHLDVVGFSARTVRQGGVGAAEEFAGHAAALDAVRVYQPQA